MTFSQYSSSALAGPKTSLASSKVQEVSLRDSPAQQSAGEADVQAETSSIGR